MNRLFTVIAGHKENRNIAMEQEYDLTQVVLRDIVLEVCRPPQTAPMVLGCSPAAD